MSNKYGILLNSSDFSDNIEIVDTALDLVRKGIYDFIQLMALPDSYSDTHAIISEKMKGINAVIHAPHFLKGIDSGNKELELSNLKKLEDSQKFADLLKAKIIVLHPGLGDGESYLEESIRQFINFSMIRESPLKICHIILGQTAKCMEQRPNISKKLFRKSAVNFVSILLTQFAHVIH